MVFGKMDLSILSMFGGGLVSVCLFICLVFNGTSQHAYKKS